MYKYYIFILFYFIFITFFNECILIFFLVFKSKENMISQGLFLIFEKIYINILILFDKNISDNVMNNFYFEYFLI
jgi:hypothetical protein